MRPSLLAAAAAALALALPAAAVVVEEELALSKGPAAIEGSGLQSAAGSDGGPKQLEGDAGVAGFLSRLDLCLIDPKARPEETTVDVPILGKMWFTSLCCKGTIIRGFDFSVEAHQGREKETFTFGDDYSVYDRDLEQRAGGAWQGDSLVRVKLRRVETSCKAQYRWHSDDDPPMRHAASGRASENASSAASGGSSGSADDEPHRGEVEMRLSTIPGLDFFDVSLDFRGEPIAVGGTEHPWPGALRETSCELGVDVAELSCTGARGRCLQLVADARKPVKYLLRKLACTVFASQLQSELRDVLAQARAFAEPILSPAPGAFPAPPLPSAPEGAGPSFDLRSATALRFLSELLAEGSTSGGLAQLLARVTNGTGGRSVRLGPAGVQLANETLDGHPAFLEVSGYIDEVGLEGLDTLSGLGFEVQDGQRLAFSLSQEALNLSASLRAVVASRARFGGKLNETPAVWSTIETLLERTKLRVRVSNVSIAGALGLLLDRDRIAELEEGVSWHEDACIFSIYQNVSLLGVLADVTLDDLAVDTDAEFSDQLEADLDRALRSLARFLSAPEARPTVSRLLKGFLAGPGRDLVNVGMQEFLASPPEGECINIIGAGSKLVVGLFSSFGVLLGTLAVARRSSSRLAARAGGQGPSAARCMLLTAGAGLCFVLAGTSAWPMRAAVRMSGPKDVEGASSMIYVFAIDYEQLAENIPWAMTPVSLGLLFAFARVGLLGYIAWSGPQPRARALLRWSVALGAWQGGFLFLVIGTQVPSFYAKILTFGRAYMDLGAQVNTGFYLCALGLGLVELGSLGIYDWCSLPIARTTAPRPQTTPRFALCGLAVCLAILVPAPWFTLWTHEFGGLLGNAFHYDQGSYTTRISVAHSFDTMVARDLNPETLFGWGSYVMQFLFFLYVVFAPLAHGFISLLVGLYLRRDSLDFLSSASEPPLANTRSDGGAAAAVQSSSSAAAASGAGAGISSVEAHSSGSVLPFVHSFEGSELGPPSVRFVLVVLRAFSGADAFAVCMLFAVPDLANQLQMMAAPMCAHMDPLLEQLDVKCISMSSRFEPGLFVLLFAAIGVRCFSELCAHRPLRGVSQPTTMVGSPTKRGQAWRSEEASPVRRLGS